jgi:hypothetical protein
LAIILSRNVSPGFVVIRTMIPIRQDPRPAGDGAAVAAALLMTGALSPVMALSSTDAMPTTTSPSRE